MSVPGPTKIKLGNHSYKVAYGHIDDPSGDFLYGRTQARKTLIEIDNNVAPSQQRDTLLHEVLHAVISDIALSFEDALEERVVRSVTPVLLGVLRDNPTLLAFLLAKDN